jgi:hypothetical protein
LIAAAVICASAIAPFWFVVSIETRIGSLRARKMRAVASR